MKRSRIQVQAERSLRAGRLEGVIDAPKSGRWGDWVYYMRGGKQCRRRYVVPRDPGTPAQLFCRAALGTPSKEWGSDGLAEEEREACRAAGARVKTRRRLGQGGTQTGQLYFVGRECSRRAAEFRRQQADVRREKEEFRRQKEEPNVRSLGLGGASDARIRLSAPSRSGCLPGRPHPQGRRDRARSTWDEYRHGSVLIRSHYRRRRRGGRPPGGCRRENGGRMGSGWSRCRRELWRGS